MWSLKPFKSPPSKCPSCSFNNAGFEDFQFTGLHILGKGKCGNCGTMYYHNWPIGHGADFPIAFTKNGLATFPKEAEQWMAQPLIQAIKNDLQVQAPLNRIKKKEITRALLLNCLDPCYGHIVWKLFNGQYYQNINAPQGIVVLIPETCIWMVPDHVSEIWTVPLPLKDFNKQISDIKPFLEEMMRCFESLQILPVHTHMDHQGIDFYQFFKSKPFQLSQFGNDQCCITFIWREDRLWLRTRLEEWLSLLIIKFSLNRLRPYLLFRQLLAIKIIGKKVKQKLPNAKFKVVGVGNWGNFPVDYEDLRTKHLNEDPQKHWCSVYAESHLVVGVHGSNMLIPTALAAGFIELLPNQKIPFVSQDILLRHSPRFQTFLGRHLSLRSSTGLIAAHIISIFKDFPYLYKNATANHE